MKLKLSIEETKICISKIKESICWENVAGQDIFFDNEMMPWGVFRIYYEIISDNRNSELFKELWDKIFFVSWNDFYSTVNGNKLLSNYEGVKDFWPKLKGSRTSIGARTFSQNKLIEILKKLDMEGLESSIIDSYIRNTGGGNYGKHSPSFKSPQIQIFTKEDENEIAQIEEVISKLSDPNDEDIGSVVKAIVNKRNGQNKFRQRVIERCMNKCIITNIDIQNILVASHILEWSKCSPKEKVDGDNGLLLSPHIDKLFDKHLISFDKDGKMLVNNNIKNVLDIWMINYLDKKYNVYINSSKTQEYMEKHRKIFEELK